MNRLERTRNKIIQEAFPELTGVPISVGWKKMRGTYLESILEPNNFSIKAAPELKKASDQVLEGGMAHELAHIAIEYGMGVMLSMLDGWLQQHSKLYSAWDERRTDRMVIERGYGPQLYQFAVYRQEQRRLHNRPDKRDGLTPEKIRMLVNQRARK